MSKSLGKATLWTAGATFVKLFSGLLAVLEDVRQELPHLLVVVVDEILDPDTDTTGSRVKGEGRRLQVRVSLVVERDPQKTIMIHVMAFGWYSVDELPSGIRKGRPVSSIS